MSFIPSKRGFAHKEHADRPHERSAAGESGFFHDYHYVERIAVRRMGAGDETVISGIVDRRVQDAVEANMPRRMVVLVLVAAPLGDLDDRLDRLEIRCHVQPPAHSQITTVRNTPQGAPPP